MRYRSRQPNMAHNAPEKSTQGFLFALIPYLGGIFMAAPFTDAAMPEVCARIVFRLIEQQYRRTRQEKPTGANTITTIIQDLEPLRGSLIYSCALAALYAYRCHTRLADWRATAVALSRLGCGFRRCWYDDYKANRRDPRVTNRGVRRSGS